VSVPTKSENNRQVLRANASHAPPTGNKPCFLVIYLMV